MIERLGLRTGGFVATTAERTLRSVVQMLPGAQPPPRRPRVLRVLPTLAGTAVGLAAGAVTAAGRSTGARNRSGSKGPGRRGSSPSANGNSAGARTRSSARRTAHKAAGATKDLAEKSRQELYDLARKAGIEGRSGMSKKELARALSR